MANYRISSRHVGKQCVGKALGNIALYVKRTLELKTRFFLTPTTCGEPSARMTSLLKIGFSVCMYDMRATYGILDCDRWNFDGTGFMMGVNYLSLYDCNLL